MSLNFTYDFAEFNGKIPMVEYLETLSIKNRAKIFAYIEKLLELKNKNILPNTNLSKHLNSGIFELRIKLDNKIARCLYFYMSEQKIIFTNGFTKKSNKTPKGIIKKAKLIMENYGGNS